MSDIKIAIDDIYINLILMSILRQRDFSKLVLDTEEELKAQKAEITSFLPEGYDGLYFVELLSRKMGSSLGEVYSFSQERKDEIIYSLINNIKDDGILIGEIVNVNADESILTDGQIDYKKLKPITYDPVTHDYVALGTAVGKAFSDGMKLK